MVNVLFIQTRSTCRSVVVLMFSCLFVLMVNGCGGSNKSSANVSQAARTESLLNVDLSGTWREKGETRVYHDVTGEYMYSQFYYGRFMMRDTDAGLQIRSCARDYSSINWYGIKTPKRLYFSDRDEGYEYAGDDVLTREYHYQDTFAYLENYVSIARFTKISESELSDAGVFDLSEPVVFQNNSKVCVVAQSWNNDPERLISVSTEMQNRLLELSIQYTPPLAIGTYYWVKYSNVASQVGWVDLSVDRMLMASLFNDDDDDFRPETATIVVVENSMSALTIEFSMVDEYGRVFEGEFTVDPQWLIFENNL